MKTIENKGKNKFIGKPDRIERLEARLEIDYALDVDGNRISIPPSEREQFPDGITCRDATIKLQDEAVDKLKARVAVLEDENRRLKEVSEMPRYHFDVGSGKPLHAGMRPDPQGAWVKVEEIEWLHARIATTLCQEQQRAMRIVKEQRAQLGKTKASNGEARFYKAGAMQACTDILRALKGTSLYMGGKGPGAIK